MSPSSSLRLGLFPENGIERPAVFPFQTPQKLQPLFDGLQTGRIEREAFRIIAEGEGGIFDPVVELLHLLFGELQTRVDLPDLLHGRDRAAELRQHGAAFPVEGLIGRPAKSISFWTFARIFFSSVRAASSPARTSARAISPI